MKSYLLKYFLLMIILTLLSCSENKIEFDKLTQGSWKMTDIINPPDQNISEKTIYTEDGKIITEIKLNGKVFETLNSNYLIDKSKRVITTEFQKRKKKFYIEELNDSIFNVKDLDNNKIIRSVRSK